MNIFADENIPQQIVTQLRAEGHQVEYVMQQVEDRIILENAYKQKALLITSDKDFGRLVLDEGKPTAGSFYSVSREPSPLETEQES